MGQGEGSHECWSPSLVWGALPTIPTPSLRPILYPTTPHLVLSLPSTLLCWSAPAAIILACTPCSLTPHLDFPQVLSLLTTAWVSLDCCPPPTPDRRCPGRCLCPAPCAVCQAGAVWRGRCPHCRACPCKEAKAPRTSRLRTAGTGRALEGAEGAKLSPARRSAAAARKRGLRVWCKQQVGGGLGPSGSWAGLNPGLQGWETRSSRTRFCARAQAQRGGRWDPRAGSGRKPRPVATEVRSHSMAAQAGGR